MLCSETPGSSLKPVLSSHLAAPAGGWLLGLGAEQQRPSPGPAAPSRTCSPGARMATITCTRFTEEYQLFEELGK